jgi:CHASE2 domain-containing sensor protein
MSPLERRLFTHSLLIGISVTLLVLMASALGWVDSLEYWLYDQRAAHCQWNSTAPTSRLVHLDIDDGSLDAIGRWPWPRATLARIIDEVQRCQPKTIGLDILLAEPQPVRLVQDPDGSLRNIDDDAKLAQALGRGDNTILGASFYLDSTDSRSPLLAKAVQWLTDDLEMSSRNFEINLYESGGSQLDSSQVEDLFIRARRLAMKERIDHELDKAPATEAELIARLLPHTDPTVHSVLIRLLEDQSAASRSAHMLSRFGAPNLAISPPPIHGTLSVVPIATFSSVAAGCGITNYDIFENSTVRSVPLFVEYKNKLYPQMGLAIACLVVGADPKAVRYDGSNIVIPAPGKDISIPTFVYHSRSRGLDVPLIAAVPWFGTGDWETMYDWPAHRMTKDHISIAKIWDTCTAIDRIAKNSASIDEAISQILDDDREDKLRLDPSLGKKYAASRPDLQDTVTREKWAEQTLKELQDSGWLDAFKQMSDKDMTPLDRFQRDKMNDANDVLHKTVAENRQLRAQIDQQRSELAAEMAGKGVLVGFTATGFEDKVSTSLHVSCPGVIVHGVIANAVLTGVWWHITPPWITILLTVVFGIATAAAQGWFSPVRGSLLTLSLLIGYALVNGLVLFGWQKWVVGLASPTLAIIMVWAGCTLYRLIAEGIERNRIGKEVAVINREMELARQVQVALIPTESPKVSGVESEGWALPASMTGGDCYDLWELKDGRLAILLADASGHGLAPAMVVSQVRTLVRTLSDFESHPHHLLKLVNARLAADLESCRFITAFLGFLRSDGELHWASAGHGPMFWCPTNNGEMLELDSTGMPLGIEPNWIADPPGPPLQLQSNGLLVIFSDGIIEAFSPAGEQFGPDRVKAILHDNCGKPCDQIIATLRSAVQKWQCKIEPVDDQTIVVVRRVEAHTQIAGLS